MGHLVVRKTPDRLRKRPLIAKQIGNRALGKYHTLTVYNDRDRVLWRVPRAQLAELIDGLNPGLPPEPVEELKRKKKPEKTAAAAASAFPATPPPGQHPPGMAMIAPRIRPVPSRTSAFRRR